MGSSSPQPIGGGLGSTFFEGLTAADYLPYLSRFIKRCQPENLSRMRTSFSHGFLQPFRLRWQTHTVFPSTMLTQTGIFSRSCICSTTFLLHIRGGLIIKPAAHASIQRQKLRRLP